MFFPANVILQMHSYFLEHLLFLPSELLLNLQDPAQMYFLYKAFPDPDSSELDQPIILYTWSGLLSKNPSLQS